MKLKNLLCTLGLAAVLGIGVGAGLAAKQDVKETRAAQTSWYVVGTFSGISKWTAGTGYAMTNTEGDKWVKEELSFAQGDEFKVCDEDTGSWQGGWSFNNGESSSAIKECFTADGDGANIVCQTAGFYNVEFDKSTWHITITACEVTSYNVGFDEDGDGVADVTTPVASGSKAVSYTPYIFGKVFGAWKLGNAVYDFDTPVTADILLTATWTNRTGELGYIYVVTGYGASWATRYIYGYGTDDGYGPWKGTLVSEIAVGCTSTTNFGGGSDEYKNGGIYKVPYYTADTMTNVILHNNGSDEDRSGDLPFGEGYGYFFKNNPWDEEGDQFDEAGIATIGKAAAYVYHFDELLSGKNFCTELDASQCAALYNAYLTAIDGDDTAKGWIDSSCINTSNGGDNVQLSVILTELRKIAVRGGQTVNDSNRMTIVSSDSMIYIAVVAFAAISACGLFFIIKRRKHADK